ncbi:MAG: hypothetical protein IBX55_17855 [Methyloprofundus sp.]|nr:hypothetical protein [Methyloprofundus sp.]
MNSEKKSISAKNILFDTQNPRHDPSEDQVDALQKLLKDEDIRSLAADIVKHGVNPTETLIVMPSGTENNKHIVLEGNRRLAALKVLQKPTLCLNKQDEKYFASLKKKYSGDFLVPCTVVKTRKDAEHWILIKHGTDLGGASTKRWNATQNARFADNTSTSSPNQRAYTLLKYAYENALITKDQHDKINITTITRYLSSPLLRKSLGIDFKNNWIQSNLQLSRFNDAVQRFLLDDLKSVEDGGLSSRSNASDRENYGHKLVAELHLHEAREKSYKDVPKINSENKMGNINDEQSQSIRDNKNPNKRSKVIPYEFKLTIQKPKIKRIYDELKSIDPKHYTNAAAFLFRGFIELTIHYYLESVLRRHEEQRDLHKHIITVADDLESKEIHKKKLSSLRAIATTPTQSSPLSIKLMNNYVHGTVEPSATDLILAWDPIQEAVRLIYDEINKTPSGQTQQKGVRSLKTGVTL